MNQPDPEFEKKVLREVVRQMDDPEAIERDQRRMRKTLLGIGSALMLVGFFLAINDLAHAFIIAVVAAAGGTAIGFGVFAEWAQKQWPVTREYIDMERIRKRLEELENTKE